eukprot:1829080-Amphidinium_carterae.1
MNPIVNVSNIGWRSNRPQLSMRPSCKASMRTLHNAVIKSAKYQGAQWVALDQAMYRREGGLWKLMARDMYGMRWQ